MRGVEIVALGEDVAEEVGAVVVVASEERAERDELADCS